MAPADFELNLDDHQEIIGRLGELWQGAEHDILRELSEKILALAPAFDGVEDVDEVSPFIYVMF